MHLRYLFIACVLMSFVAIDSQAATACETGWKTAMQLAPSGLDATDKASWKSVLDVAKTSCEGPDGGATAGWENCLQHCEASRRGACGSISAACDAFKAAAEAI